MTKEASYQIDCACAKNLCQNFGRAMALPALPVPPGLLLHVCFFPLPIILKLYHGKPSLQRHRLSDIQLSKEIPWQLCQPVDIAISTRLIWLPCQVAGNQLPIWVGEAEFLPLSPPPNVCEDKFGYIGLLHLHYLWAS